MTNHRLRLSALIYGALAAAAIVWGGLRGQWLLFRPSAGWADGSASARIAVSLALGLAVAAITIAGTRVLVRKSSHVRALHSEFHRLFGPLSGSEIALFAVFSGVAEELFFRGAMQPALGVVLTSIIFGLVHIGPTRRFWIWTLWATLMGFVFGFIAWITGDIFGTTLAHVLINYENMHFIAGHDPERNAGHPYATLPEPNLVGKPTRS
ncbi:MAG: CPBP family intramembrane metalloprotease [Sandaracinaceae bacterium]|nr:CPBP family intramembrane metalloprotease [Sandaracinaceae bacterium]